MYSPLGQPQHIPPPTPTLTVPSTASLPMSREHVLLQEARAFGITDQVAQVQYMLGIRNTTPRLPTPTVKGPPLRMDKWDKGETWELFIHRFERLARDLLWDEPTKLLQLVTCLSGKSLEIYRRTDRSRDTTYAQLRAELEKAFSLTAEQLALQFSTACHSREESVTQFHANL